MEKAPSKVGGKRSAQVSAKGKSKSLSSTSLSRTAKERTLPVSRHLTEHGINPLERVAYVRSHSKIIDTEWHTTSRTTGEVVDTFRARDLWRKIANASWACADTGLQFDTPINAWYTCAVSDRIQASNPCSEFLFLNDTACNLASLNLVKFLRSDGSFDVETFQHACRIFSVAQGS